MCRPHRLLTSVRQTKQALPQRWHPMPRGRFSHLDVRGCLSPSAQVFAPMRSLQTESQEHHPNDTHFPPASHLLAAWHLSPGMASSAYFFSCCLPVSLEDKHLEAETWGCFPVSPRTSTGPCPRPILHTNVSHKQNDARTQGQEGEYEMGSGGELRQVSGPGRGVGLEILRALPGGFDIQETREGLCKSVFSCQMEKAVLNMEDSIRPGKSISY